MKNAVFWDVTLCGSCNNRHIGAMYRLHLHRFLRRVHRLLVIANVVPSSPILHPDGEGDTFLRNVGAYKSHTA
jgi:hypothetical protein